MPNTQHLGFLLMLHSQGNKKRLSGNRSTSGVEVVSNPWRPSN